MFCTTECWNCEDKNCEHYISKQELYFENQQLKRNCNIGYEELNFYRGEYKKIKPVLDEIREYIEREASHYAYEDDYDFYLCEEQIEELLQILDKAVDLC